LQFPTALQSTPQNSGISSINFTGKSPFLQNENLKKYSVPSPLLNVTYDVYEMPPLENGSSPKQMLQNIYSASPLNQSSGGINIYNTTNTGTVSSGPASQVYQSSPQPQGQPANISQKEQSVRSFENQSSSGLKPDNLPGQSMTTTGSSVTTLSSSMQKMANLNQTTTHELASTNKPNMTENLVGPQGRAISNSSSIVTSTVKVSSSTPAGITTSVVAVDKTNNSSGSQNTASNGLTSTATTTNYANSNSSVSIHNSSSSLNLTHSAMNNASSQPVLSSFKSNNTTKTGTDYSNSEKSENVKTTTEEGKTDKQETTEDKAKSTEATTLKSHDSTNKTLITSSEENNNTSRSIGMDYSVVETESEIKIPEAKNTVEKTNSSGTKSQTDDAKKDANNSKFPSTTTESLIKKNSTEHSSIESTTLSSTTSKDKMVTTSGHSLESSSEKPTKEMKEDLKETKGMTASESAPTNNTTLAPPAGNNTEGKSSDGPEGLNMHITINDKSKGASYKTVNMSTDSLLEEEKQKKDGGEDYQDGGNIFPLEHSPRKEAGPSRSIPKHQILNINNFKSVGAPRAPGPRDAGKAKKWMNLLKKYVISHQFCIFPCLIIGNMSTCKS
jgi:hypothetical protein